MLSKNMQKESRKCQLCGFGTAHHVGILFSTADSDWKAEMSSFLEFLRTKHIRFTAMGYLAQPHMAVDECLPMCQYYSAKDLSWLKIPKSESLIYNFMVQQFDMLINCNACDDVTARYIMHVSPSFLKIGSRFNGDAKAPCDLLLDLPQRHAISPFFDVLKQYLPLLTRDSAQTRQNTI